MNIIDAHTLSFNNKKTLKGDCACFNCLSVFSSLDIKDYISDPLGTALCPNCHIDCVIPKTSEITQEFLSQMHEFWFKNV